MKYLQTKTKSKKRLIPLVNKEHFNNKESPITFFLFQPFPPRVETPTLKDSNFSFLLTSQGEISKGSFGTKATLGPRSWLVRNETQGSKMTQQNLRLLFPYLEPLWPRWPRG